MDKFFIPEENISYYSLTGYLFRQTFKKEQRRIRGNIKHSKGTYGNCLITFFFPSRFGEKITLANLTQILLSTLLIGILDYFRGLKEVVQSTTSPLRNCM